MFTIDMSTTKNALDQLEKDPENWDNFLSKFDDKKFYPNVKFGQALFFLPYIYHGSDINKSDDRRIGFVIQSYIGANVKQVFYIFLDFLKLQS